MKIKDWLICQPISGDTFTTHDLWNLLGHLLNKNTAWVIAHQDFQLNQQQINSLNGSVADLLAGKPLAYITGEKDFWDLTLQVNQSTLIPRPETETLIEAVIDLVDSPEFILDLGTGSGAIALSLGKYYPNARVIATDCSKEALQTAESNASINGVTNVELIHSNWFEQISCEKFDLIVSNPPYIDTEDEHLSKLKYEPLSALVAEDNGLADFKRITQQANHYLAPNGLLMFEHGWNQKTQVQNILKDSHFMNIATRKDILGHNRVTWGYRSKDL